MTKFKYDPQMQPTYKTVNKEDILNETTNNIVITEIEFAKKFIDTHIEKRNFVLTDCKNVIIDFLKMKKEAISMSLNNIWNDYQRQRGQKTITVNAEDLAKLLQYIDKQ